MNIQLSYSGFAGWFVLLMVLPFSGSRAQNRDPLATQIITEDIDRFWIALEKSGPAVDPAMLKEHYLQPGSKGVEGFTPRRIRNAEHLATVIRSHTMYYHSIRPSLDSIAGMKDQIRQSLVRLKELYPQSVFPPVYFVVGALSSGGTTSDDGLIIGAEMYGLSAGVPMQEMNQWQRTVLKPVNQVPHIVAHELIHFQQTYDGATLLSASIKEGAADFLAELISGRHINAHVHDFANPIEKQLWKEFKEKMDGKDYTGWLYSGTEGRPNDLGYWMGYKITKAYYDQATDKQKAVEDILTIKNFKKFLAKSGYQQRVESAP